MVPGGYLLLTGLLSASLDDHFRLMKYFLQILITMFSNDNVPLIDLGLLPPAGRDADLFAADARRYGLAPASLFPLDALSRYGKSIVIFNDRDQAPDPAQLQSAKASGAMIAFSSGGETKLDPARFKRRLLAIKAARLSWQDFWLPGKN